MPNIYVSGNLSGEFLTRDEEDVADSKAADEDAASVELMLGRFTIPFNGKDLESGTFSLKRSEDATKWSLDLSGVFKIPVQAKVMNAFDEFNSPDKIRWTGVNIGNVVLPLDGVTNIFEGVPCPITLSKKKP